MATNPVEALKKLKSPFSGHIISDYMFKIFIIAIGIGVPILMLYLYLNTLLSTSIIGFQKFGVGGIINADWDIVQQKFGLLTFIYGTTITSFFALLIALPLSILSSVFIYEYVPMEFKSTIRNTIDVLAGIPSVIYGLWGIFILIPFLNSTLFQFINDLSGGSKTIVTGYNIFTAGLVLAIMIIPILVNIIMEGFDTVPTTQREALTSLGATRWEVSKIVMVGSTKATIFIAVMLGLGRALGETLAVTMVIGNSNDFPNPFYNIFQPGQTISSLLANEFGEASGLQYIVLIEAALVLFIITTLFNIIGIIVLRRLKGGNDK